MPKSKDSGWTYYLPDSSETADDALPIKIYDWQKGFYNAEDAAEAACELDFDERDGWERGMESEFPIVVISPKGEETRFIGWHEPSVAHYIKPAT